MDTHIGDLHPSVVGKISLPTHNRPISIRESFIDREIEIIQELQSRILVYDEAMGHACDVCAELDVLLSFAEVSRAYDYRRPRMVDESVIDIIGGRYASAISNISEPSHNTSEGIHCKSRL
jgi:DNA mismatch repair protein MSH5